MVKEYCPSVQMVREMVSVQVKQLLIEKVHLDDLDLYVITFIALATSV